MDQQLPNLTPEDHAIYEWQMWVDGFGELGQQRLKGATVLVSRIGGLGGVVAWELAAAGVGKLLLAHAGNVKPSDLNRQLLMHYEAIGKSRVETAQKSLKEFNPAIEIEAIPENINAGNARKLVEQVDLAVGCAPLFEERLALSHACFELRKPLVDCAMYELTFQVTTIQPGQTACLACRVPAPPPEWKRQFPVIGAVSGIAGCIGATEAIKLITKIGDPLYNKLLMGDCRTNRFQQIQLQKNPTCSVCGQLQVSSISES